MTRHAVTPTDDGLTVAETYLRGLLIGNDDLADSSTWSPPHKRPEQPPQCYPAPGDLP